MGGRRAPRRGVAALTVVLVLVLVAAALSGCGADPQERADFEAFLEAVRPFTVQFTDDVLPVIARLQRVTADTDPREILAMYREMAVIYGSYTEGLRSVEPFPGLAAEYGAALSAAEELTTLITRLEKALRHMLFEAHTAKELQPHLRDFKDLARDLQVAVVGDQPALTALDEAIVREGDRLNANVPDWYAEVSRKIREANLPAVE